MKLKPWADASKVKAGLLDAKPPEEWQRLYFDTYLNANVPAEVRSQALQPASCNRAALTALHCNLPQLSKIARGAKECGASSRGAVF